MTETGRAPLVSVALATFNGEAYVEAQIRSVLRQDLEDLELVVSDDGSTDQTREICRDLAASDDRIRILPGNGGCRGSLQNFERALAATRGRYIAFSDQDDLWDPCKLSLLVGALQEDPQRDLAFCDLRIVDEEGKTIARSFNRYQRLGARGGKPFRALLYRNFVTGCASMITERLKRVALPFPRGCRYHDWWLATVAAARGGIVYVDRPVMAYRQHRSNVVGASGAGLARVCKTLVRTAALTEEEADRQDLDRVRSYQERRDAIVTSPARQADLDAALRSLEDFAERRRLGLLARLRVLGVWLRYMVRRELLEIMVVTARVLAPDLTAKVVRRFRPSGSSGETLPRQLSSRQNAGESTRPR